METEVDILAQKRKRSKMCPLPKRCVIRPDLQRQSIQGTGRRPAHINLDNTDLATGEARIRDYLDAFGRTARASPATSTSTPDS